MSVSTARPDSPNIAALLADRARRDPEAPAVLRASRSRQTAIGFGRLDATSNAIAIGLRAMGITPGTRALMMVPPGPDLFQLVFAVLKAGVVPVLIDPGIGRKYLGQCAREAEPEVFIGIPKAILAGHVFGWGQSTIRRRIVVAPRRVFVVPGAISLAGLIRYGSRRLGQTPLPADPLPPDAPAAILFTSGSTGPPKGAVYTQEILKAQVATLRELFAIEPGEVDLCTFPLFALFAPALGMTSIVPEMNPTRPARARPSKIVGAIQRHGATNLFGSPALLHQLVRGDDASLTKLPTLKRVVSAGAPVPARTIERMARRLVSPAQVHTVYGATEALPVASIGSDEILGETRHATDQGRGVCVGRPVPGIEVRMIRIDDEPIPEWSDDLLVSDGTIGEIVVSGSVVTREYFQRPEATRLAKILDPARGIFYHRMGDVGYLDARGRIWFCGRKSHRVVLEDEVLFTIPCESIFNTHPDVYRSALVGVERGSRIEPVICVEPVHRFARPRRDRLRAELLDRAGGFPQTRRIQTVLFHPSFPVDIRHNSKIFREKLAAWAARRLA